MTEIEMDCPHCGQHIQCDEGYRGMQINCPTCKQLFLIPTVQNNPPTLALERPPPHTQRTFIAKFYSPKKGEIYTTSQGLFIFLLFLVPILLLMYVNWDRVFQGIGHLTAKKPGSLAYLDSKNGIGGFSFGASVASFEGLGFAPDGPTSGEQIYYTNDAYHITFGDYYLDEIKLRFISDKLVYISGSVNCSNEPDNGDVLSFLTAQFGPRTSYNQTQDSHAMQDSEGNVHIYSTPGSGFLVWKGKSIELSLIEAGRHPLLELELSRSIEAEYKTEQAQKEKKEKEQTERMRKQNF